MLLKNNVLSLFLENPTTEFYLRELAKRAKCSTTAVHSSATELIKDGVVLQQRKGVYRVFKANRLAEAFRNLKRFYTADKLLSSGLIDHLETLFHHPEAVVLFGSAAKGEDTEKSDLDIFVLASPRDVDMDAYESKLGKSIRLLVFDNAMLERAKKKNPELVNNILNGLILRGYLKVLP